MCADISTTFGLGSRPALTISRATLNRERFDGFDLITSTVQQPAQNNDWSDLLLPVRGLELLRTIDNAEKLATELLLSPENTVL